MLVGFHPQPGNPRAVKKLVIKLALDIQVVKNEIIVNEALGDYSGIVKFYG